MSPSGNQFKMRRRIAEFLRPSSFGRAFETTRYVRRWIGISVLIGIVAGVGALALSEAIHYMTILFLGFGAHYMPPSPVGEGSPTIVPVGRVWALPLVTALGGLISGLIIFNLAPEAEGHGTDEAIAAIHFHRGRIRPRIPLIKLIASAITIGSGGSGGREGPTAQISAGFGSVLGDLLHLDDDDRRTAVAIGIGAGIGAVFRAPLGGAVLAAEILYVQDIEVEVIIPSLIASIVGYSVFGTFVGFEPLFGQQGRFDFTQPIQLLYYAALGVICGLLGMLYARSFYATTDFFHRTKLPRALKPMIGGFLVGCMGIVMPQVLYMGYGWIQIAMSMTLLTWPLWIILLLPFMKILSTSFSIGSGGSGGVFGPGMVIGAMVGASVWRLGYQILPGMPTNPAPFVIIGMMALYGGIAHAPIAVMLMVAEMTGNLSLLGPAMLAVGISYFVVGDYTIYRAQIGTRSDSTAHRGRLVVPVLSSLIVADAQKPAPVVFDSATTVAEARTVVVEKGIDAALVLDSQMILIGVVDASELSRIAESEPLTRLDAVAHAMPLVAYPSQTVDVALETMGVNRRYWLPVVVSREDHRLVGIITTVDIVRAYRNARISTLSGLRGFSADGQLFDLTVARGAIVADQPLSDLHLKFGALVLSIHRGVEIFLPRASTRVLPGDKVTVLSQKDHEKELQGLFEVPRPDGQHHDVTS